MTTTEQKLAGEHAELLETLGKHRFFLRYTVRGLTDEQAARTPTASGALPRRPDQARDQGGTGWIDFAIDGPQEQAEPDVEGHLSSFRMLPGETLAGLLADYEAAAAAPTSWWPRAST